MTHDIAAKWMGDMQFDADVNGHTITMDAAEKVGGHNKGPIPKPFVLTALSGCTGMDVATIMRKSKRELSSFNIKVSGTISEQQPIEYTAIHIVYEFEGRSEDRDAAIKAVNLSQEKYCGVSHMLKKIMPVTWDIMYNREYVYSNIPKQECNN